MSITAISSLSLPVELIEHIMLDVWRRPLSTHDRATFMKSSLAVSRTWTSIYMRMFCEDVHIPSASFALQFLSILRNQSPLYNHYTRNGRLFNRCCRSISFQRDDDPGGLFAPINPESKPKAEHPMGIAIFAVLQALFFSPYILPKLERISIQFNNAPMHDLFARNKFMGFPPQVKELEIDFTYDPRTPSSVIDAIASDPTSFHLSPGRLGHVRRLKVVGVSRVAIHELIVAASNWEELEWEICRRDESKEELEAVDEAAKRCVSFLPPIDLQDLRNRKMIAGSILVSTIILLAYLGSCI